MSDGPAYYERWNLQVPQWTNATRGPGLPGAVGFNTQTGNLECWNGSEWAAVGSGGGGSGMVLISSGSITTPISYFDVELTTGYDYYEIQLHKILLQGSNNSAVLAMALSSDGGATFWNDAAHFDTYSAAYFDAQYNPNATLQAFQHYLAFDASVYGGVGNFDNGSFTFGRVGVNPGTGSESPIIYLMDYFTWVEAMTVGEVYGSFDSGTWWLNPSATVPPAYAKANLIRFSPYGNGDFAPPTSGDQIYGGKWFLFGIPSA